MYEFVLGPLVWIAFIVFIGGSLYKIATLLYMAREDKNVFPVWRAKHGFRSVLHWVIPFGSKNMRMRPGFTLVSYTFHVCLLLTPLFIMGHAVMWKNGLGIRWWSLPACLADLMALVVIVAWTYLMLRRIAAPQVRNVNGWRELVVGLIVVAPFVTGFIAHQQWLPYRATLIIHVITGALWLAAIPFTWLSHMFYFVFTRSFMGSEFGFVRNARDW